MHSFSKLINWLLVKLVKEFLLLKTGNPWQSLDQGHKDVFVGCENITKFKICRGLENFRELIGKMQGKKLHFDVKTLENFFFEIFDASYVIRF